MKLIFFFLSKVVNFFFLPFLGMRSDSWVKVATALLALTLHVRITEFSSFFGFVSVLFFVPSLAPSLGTILLNGITVLTW